MNTKPEENPNKTDAGMSVHLPKRSWPLWTIAVVLWIGQPFLNYKFLIITSLLGWYPPEADSIGIPIVGGVILAIVGAPFWLLLCHRAFRQYPGDVSFFIWSREHGVYSAVITSVFVCLTLISLWTAKDHLCLFLDIRRSKHADKQLLGIYLTFSSIAWAALWLCMRSCFVAKRIIEPQK